MSVIQISKIQVRRGQEKQTGIPRLDPGEFGWAEDTENLYIGKRVAEGAVDDNNTRLLTTNDLDNIFSLIGSSVTNAISYKYREGVSYIPHAETRKLQDRLDDEVSLASFGVIPSFTSTDITSQFQNAIYDLFQNDPTPLPNGVIPRLDARRVLIIPAGNYSISSVISLPPYITLKGQGQEITTLTLTSSDTHMFETVDAYSNNFAAGMQSGAYRARNVTIQDMTLQYSTGTVNNNTLALLALNNVINAKIKSVSFKTAHDIESTTTYGLVSSGQGISIQGTGGSRIAAATNLCENIYIDKCQFDSLATGVSATGTVVRPIVSNSILSNLGRGIIMHGSAVNWAPTNGVFRSNRFENVVAEGIYASSSTNITSHISENNYFVSVGNGVDLDDFTTTSTGKTPVITFNSSGNTSMNDYFNRKTVADTTTRSDFYYNPLVSGSVAVNNNTAITLQTAAVTTASIMKIGLNNQDQHLSVRYQMTNSGLSRKGNLIINIARDGFSSITDTYNYILDTITVSDSTTDMTARAGSGIDTLVVNGPNTGLSTLVGSSDGYFLTGSSAYVNLSASVLSISQSGSSYTILTTSTSPQFDYSAAGETFTLVQSGSDSSFFITDETHVTDKNYVTLAVQDNSTVTNIEYQIDILT